MKSKLIIQKLNDKLDKVNCANCGNDEATFYFSGKDRLNGKEGIFNVVKCIHCGLIYVNPRPNIRYLIDYFYQDYFGHNPTLDKNFFQAKNKTQEIRYRIKNITLANHFDYSHLASSRVLLRALTTPLVRRMKVNLMPNYIDNGKLLEIGCSYGWRLDMLKTYGWQDVYGVELGKQAATECEHRGHNVQNKPIENVNFPLNYFDVIITSMALEHLSDPFLVLDKITNWLKPGGQFLFSVPNASGLSFKIFKGYCYTTQVPYHLYHYTNNFICKILDNNYKVKIYYQKSERDILASMKYLSEENKKYSFLSYFIRLPRVFFKITESVLALLHRTSRISVVCVKK